MRAFLVFVVFAGLGVLFYFQKQQSAPAPQRAQASRQVSEHDWAKHALDKTRAVAGQAQQHRAENGQR